MAKFVLTFVLALAVIATVQALNECQAQRLNDVKSGKAKLRGVSLGSWFCLESWMSGAPWDQNGCSKDNFQGSWQLEQCLGGRAQSVMENHWNTWVTKNDFMHMSKMGVNSVRIPVGWWQIYDQWGGVSKSKLNYHITPTNFVTGSLAHLDNAFEWAAYYGIGVILDLHAVPGSQNGNDHSAPSNTHQIYWDKYADNQHATVDAIELFAERYGQHKALLAVQLMNEPAVDVPTLQRYYVEAYNRVRKHTSAFIVINPLISPFQSGTEDAWKNFMPPSQYPGVWMDLHYYHCFGGSFDPNNPDSVIGYAGWDRKNQVQEYNRVNSKPMIVGEWSNCGVPNNRGGDLMRAQLNSWSDSHGWVFWAWSNAWTENEWSLQSAWNAGWVKASDMAAAC